MRANAQTGLSLSPSSGASAEVECDGCIITDNGVFGVVNTGGLTITAMATLRHSVIARNSVGLNSQNGASTYCTDTTITKNGTGVDAVGSGTNYSFGDNILYANTTDGAFTTILKN